MYFLYSLFSAVGLLLLSPYFLVRAARRGDFGRHLRERFGLLPREIHVTASSGRGAIWVHAVSVGEVLAAVPLARALKDSFPDRRLVVSTTTVTGQRLARERLPFAGAILYWPLDWANIVRRVFHTLRPAIIVILETEIWPNLLRQAARAGIPVAFVNGRISERSFRGYRFLNRAFNHFVEQTLQDASLFLMRNEDDAQRIRVLGAPADRVIATGNLKYDLAPPGESLLGVWLEQQISAQERWPVAVAGSIVAGEEDAVLAAFDYLQRKWRHALLILAPRKPERFDAAARIARDSGWVVVRRSALNLEAPLDDSADILVLDSIGELAALYRLADVAFIGGSLVPAGGHNLLEPAWFGKVPVFGPSMENFSDTARQFLAAQAAVQVESGSALGHVWVELVTQEERREQMGSAARSLVESSRGATARSLEHIAALLEPKGAGR